MCSNCQPLPPFTVDIGVRVDGVHPSSLQKRQASGVRSTHNFELLTILRGSRELFVAGSVPPWATLRKLFMLRCRDPRLRTHLKQAF